MEQDLDKIIEPKLKKMDKWVNYLVRHTYIRSVVFVVAFFEATISPILPEIVVAGVLAYRKDISWKMLSLISTLGSITGLSALYFTGKYLYSSYSVFFDNVFNSSSFSTYGEQIINHNTFITIFAASFTPLPDRVFAFLSGTLSLSFLVVIVAFFFGRLLRVGIVAYFSYRFGDEARTYILKHTKKMTIIVLVIVALYVFYNFFVSTSN